jgi:hypothetical protein
LSEWALILQQDHKTLNQQLCREGKFMRAPLQNRDIANEQKVVRSVREALLAEDYDRVCFEAGRFAEETAVELYTELNASRPRNAKTAIDYITDNGAVPRPLGVKMRPWG